MHERQSEALPGRPLWSSHVPLTHELQSESAALVQVSALVQPETPEHSWQTSAGPLPSSQRPSRHVGHCELLLLLQPPDTTQKSTGEHARQVSAAPY